MVEATCRNPNPNIISLLAHQLVQVPAGCYKVTLATPTRSAIIWSNFEFNKSLLILLIFLITWTWTVRSGFGTTSRPKSLALPSSSRGTVRALYAYLSSGEHQINFLEGDLILLLGDDPVSFHANANGIYFVLFFKCQTWVGFGSKWSLKTPDGTWCSDSVFIFSFYSFIINQPNSNVHLSPRWS